MKKIYFIRHAKSSWKDEELRDFDRPLNKRGKKDAPFMGGRLKSFNVMPDIIVSSPANRAKVTACTIAESVGYDSKEILYDVNLYDSSFEQYEYVIRNLKNDNDSVFIVAHNPDITEVCEIYSDTLIGSIPTCAIVCIEFNVNSFKDILPCKGKLLFFDYPKKHLGE